MVLRAEVVTMKWLEIKSNYAIHDKLDNIYNMMVNFKPK